jgi:hypothetical protein
MTNLWEPLPLLGILHPGTISGQIVMLLQRNRGEIQGAGEFLRSIDASPRWIYACLHDLINMQIIETDQTHGGRGNKSVYRLNEQGGQDE